MGRLFWKFFLCILLAQVAATIGIGGAFWLRDRARSQAAELDTGPPGWIALDAAAATLRHGGLGALRGMLGELQRPQVFVQDSQGRELLGRPVPPELEAEVRRQLASGEPRRGIRQLVGPDGERYTAFVRRPFRGAPPTGGGAAAAPDRLGAAQPAPGPGPGPASCLPPCSPGTSRARSGRCAAPSKPLRAATWPHASPSRAAPATN